MSDNKSGSRGGVLSGGQGGRGGGDGTRGK